MAKETAAARGLRPYRPATVHDADLASRLVISAWRDAYTGFLPPSLLASLHESPHHDRRSWERRILEPGATTWLIPDQAGTDVGVLRISMGTSSVPDTVCELTTLYLLADARGQGLGSAALAYARAAASRQPHEALALVSWPATSGAIHSTSGTEHTGSPTGSPFSGRETPLSKSYTGSIEPLAPGQAAATKYRTGH